MRMRREKKRRVLVTMNFMQKNVAGISQQSNSSLWSFISYEVAQHRDKDREGGHIRGCASRADEPLCASKSQLLIPAL